MNLDLNTIRVTFHFLVEYKKHYVELYEDKSDLILDDDQMRQLLKESQPLAVTKLRNWQARKKRYPDSVYYRHDRLVFAVNAQQNRLVTCFPFVGRKARHSKKPKARDRRAADKEENRRKISPFLG